MTKKKSKRPESLIVSKPIFTSSMHALGVYLENLGDIFEEIRSSSDYNTEYKQLMMSILADQIQAVSAISSGFESSLETGIEPDKTKGYLN